MAGIHFKKATKVRQPKKGCTFEAFFFFQDLKINKTVILLMFDEI